MELAVNIFYGNDTILWFDPLCQWFLKHIIKTILKSIPATPQNLEHTGRSYSAPYMSV